MAWVRIHDAAMSHPKIVGLSDAAFRAWVWGLSYAQTHLTDGAIPGAALDSRLKKRASELVLAGLWEPAEAGFTIHHFLDWNDSRTTVKARQDKAKARKDRWLERVPNASRTRPLERVPNGEPNQTKPSIENPSDSLSASARRFDAFWTAYPRKTGKDAARKAFERRKVTDALLASMLEAIAEQSRSKQWQDDGGRYIPHPATWLNQGRWQDEAPKTGPRPIGGARLWSWDDCPHEPNCGSPGKCIQRQEMDAYKAANQ